jgi:hypothetical protein
MIALLDGLSHMRLVVAVGVGTMGPLNCWVASSAAELIKQPTVANDCTATMHCSTNSGRNIGNIGNNLKAKETCTGMIFIHF